MNKTVRVLNADITYHAEGEGFAAVVFLHGDGHSWKTGTAVLSAFPAAYKRILIERPGHGSSTDIPLRKVADEVAVVEHIIRQERAKDVILVGHSGGAAVAAAYAINHPVRALVLSNPLFRDPHRIFWYLPLRFLERTYLKKAESHYGKGRFSGNEKSEEELQNAVFGETNPTTLRANLRSLDGFDVRDAFRQVTAPVLVLCAGHGLLSLSKHIKKTVQGMRNVIVESLPNATHNSFVLEHEQTNKIIQKHLSFLRA